MSEESGKKLEPSVSPANGLEDVKQLGMFAAIASLSYVFWIVGGMEMIERLAFYGVKAVASIYATDAASEGGLGLSVADYGTIGLVWAMVQSFVPVFTGGLSDRYGYKETIAVSTCVKICGYLLMAFFPTFWGFMTGAVVLALGTAIFKPGIQGTLVRATTRENSSMAWGIFYQTVNIGGFFGPILATNMRILAWQNVFFACAGIISLNFLLLLMYKEQGKEERLERNRAAKASTEARESLWRDSLKELSKKHVWLYLLVFSGFWFMFNALFDFLPLHINQWVDSTDIVQTIWGSEGGQGTTLSRIIAVGKDGKSLAPETLLNVNAFMIILFCFIFAWISGKMRATTSMVVGTLCATVALYVTGTATAGWSMVFAISIFSVGEMLSSPKFSEFIGNIAPADKKAMYLGFSQIPLGIGWSLEMLVAPRLYEHYASKDTFARELIVERGLMDSVEAAAIKNGEAFKKLVELTGEAPQALTDILYQSHNVAMVWNVMAVVGLLSAVGIYMYGRWILKLKKA